MKRVLIVILVVAALLRFTGILSGYPPYHSDEGMSYSQGVYILIERTLDANGYSLHYAYPGFIPLINAVLFKFIFIPVTWLYFYVSNIGNFIDGVIRFPLTELDQTRIFRNEILGISELNVLIWGRMISALVGTGTVYLTYRLGTRLFTKNVGLVGALYLAVNYRHVLNSHLALPDIYNSFFLLLSVFMSLRIVKDVSYKSYALAGLGVGLFLSTKFHIYSILPFVVCHINAQKAKGWELGKILCSRKLYFAGLIGLLVVMLINPWHFINFERFLSEITDVSLKYRSGRNTLDFYLYSYLYHLGIGKVLFGSTILGIILARKDTLSTSVLLSVILPFFYVITFATGGGFYTRNVITIIPFMLIYAAYFAVRLFESKKLLLRVSAVVVVALGLYTNISRSLVVATEYTKPWNYTIVETWINENIPMGSKISAHSSVRFDTNLFDRLEFDQKNDFSVEEFVKSGAGFAVMNLDWTTNDFYGWMTQDTKNSLKYWKKPVDLLEATYPALVIREFSDYSIFSITNSAFAPDSNFVVAKIPTKSATAITKLLEHTFDKDKKVSFRSWSSDYLNVTDQIGLMITYVAKLQGTNSRDGFVFVEYYSSFEDANNRRNRVAVRVSSRITSNEFTEFQFAHAVPVGARFAVVSVGVYQESQSEVYFDKLEVFEAEVIEDFGNWEPMPIKIDTDNVFPNSHGNL